MKKRLIRGLTMSLAIVLLSANITNAAPVKKPLARYNEAYNKVTNFYKEVEVTNKDGKKVKQKVETYKIVLPNEVVEVDKALQEYIQLSLMATTKGVKVEDLINSSFSMVGIPFDYVEDRKISPITALKEQRINMSNESKVGYFHEKEARNLYPVKDYDFFKDISREEFEIALAEVGKIVDLRRLQIIFSPYKVVGGNEYAIQSTIPRFEDNWTVDRVAGIVIEPTEGNNIVASMMTAIGRLVYREVYPLYAEQLQEHTDIYGTAIADNIYTTNQGKRKDSQELNWAEDFRIYLTEKTKGKNAVLDKIVNADKDSFYKKEVIYGNKDAQAIKYFDKLLKQNNYKLEPKRYDPEVRVHMKDQDGYINFFGHEPQAHQFNRLYTTSNEVTITFDDKDTINKLESVGTIRGVEDFATKYIMPQSTKIKKNKDGSYTIKLQKGVTVVELNMKNTRGGYTVPRYLDITKP